MGSDDAKLKYIDDDTDSYSNIFDNAKTTASGKDKARLIEALKDLSEGIENSDTELIESAVNVDEVLRYMVVHNFVVNGDSYTGSMIHNYYLYEKNGLLSMIPWDYNLAFGTFQGNDSTSAVNDPIDTPLSITEGSTDRPMFSWITSCEEYTEMYHEYYSEFLEQFYESGYLENLIDSVHDMIAEYVEKDPTKFCSVEEFETAVETIKSFVSLRCQSIKGQLDGSIGSTDSAQEETAGALIDASSINLSDTGSMGHGMGDRNMQGEPNGENTQGGPGGNMQGGPGGGNMPAPSGKNNGN
jgi:spore coat protein CotH